ncbi:MAG: hypothetical protein ACI3XR_04305 [Eubacteriales bacterium]
MELIWIIAGIGYVVFRLFNDGDLKFSWKALGGYILTVIPLVLGGILLSVAERNSSVAGMAVGAIIWIAWFIGLLVWSHSKPKIKTAPPKPKYTVQELQQEFHKHGYDGISRRAFENLLHNAVSPLNAGSSSTVTIKSCYTWMCEQATWEIDSLSREDLEKRLGVPLDEIPTDPSLPTGEASLKRTTYAKNYLLKKEGLRYLNFPQFLDGSDEYCTVFNHYADK